MLNALPEVIRQIPDTRLLILGDGSEKYTLEKQVNDLGITGEVIFMGFQSDPYTYILQSDVIVLPSLFEAFGLVYIEAFALKTTLIAFDAPAANEIVTNNETGLLVPKFNSEILAQKIIYLLQNSDERKRISENAYQKYLEYYTADRMIADTAKWYKSLNLHTN